jgi:N-acyl-D-aspartate/D-glutamate deacylase
MPSRLAEEAELAALVGALREHGRGLFMLTKGGQTTIEFLEELAAQSGRPVVIAALLHNSTQPDGVFADLRAIARANQRGHRLAGAVSCCPLAMDFTLHSPYTFESLESWRPALALQGEEYARRLAQPAFRAAVRAEIARPGHFRLFNGEWDKVQVVQSRRAELEGRSIATLAREAGKDPLDAMLDVALAENLDTVFSALLLNSDETAVARLLADPHALVSLSDAGAHLTFFNDAGYGLHLLGYWTRERGALTLEQAAWRLTGQPAALYGIKDRGALREGHHADLLLFDPRTVERTANRRVFDLPAGASRLTCDALGVQGVWVNGERIVGPSGVRATSRLPGRLLRDFAA